MIRALENMVESAFDAIARAAKHYQHLDVRGEIDLNLGGAKFDAATSRQAEILQQRYGFSPDQAKIAKQLITDLVVVEPRAGSSLEQWGKDAIAVATDKKAWVIVMHSAAGGDVLTVTASDNLRAVAEKFEQLSFEKTSITANPAFAAGLRARAQRANGAPTT